MAKAKTSYLSGKIGYIVMLVGASLALLASFVLSNEALTLAKNPDAVLECSVSLVLNCATVAKHASSSVLGFPNSFLGMMSLPVMITIAVAGIAGTKFPRWFMRATWIGAVVGLLFAGWMFYESYFVIRVLCPWCLLTDASMLLVAYGAFRTVAREKYLCMWPDKMAQLSKNNYDLVVLILIIVLVMAAIIMKFGDGLFA